MGRLAPLVAIAVLAFSQAAAQNSDTPACIPACANQVRADFAKLGCQNADDAKCLCNKDNFSFGVRDCGAHCGSNDDNVRRFLLGSFCAGVFSSQPTPAATSSATSATSSSQAVSTQPSSTLTTSTTQSTSSTSAAVASSSSTSVSATSSATSSPVTDAPPSSTSVDAEVSGTTSGSSQTSATGIGIGVGVGAAVVAIAGIVICLLLRSRKQKPRQSMEISKPLPGSGRAYAGREHGSFEKHGNDIEMTSHRYEDMVPRQQPRTMV
ncbi:hypothetical protein CP532_1649 [Ophiocordyceps camponoti-leonardi (nom. inval.)]|nr:hypothetical protein CP532_1649 [Ophiocordyceps camponoti-leonardi (nom. inval.)]